MTTIDAAIFDVDGTLFDYRYKKIHTSTVAALNTLRQRGIKVIIASGRSYALLGEECLVKTPADYYVLANGHSVLDGQGDTLRNDCFSKECTDHVVATANKYGAFLMLKYTDYNCIYSGYDEMFGVFNNIGLDKESFQFCPAMDRHLQELPLGFTVKGSVQTARSMQQELVGLRVELFHDESEFDIFKLEVNKMTGLRFLFDELGLQPERCVAFGDSRNDLEMLQGVGRGIAMGNSCDELKAAAYAVCPASWEDGIAVSLREMSIL